jgi:hypothetical protein
LAIYSIGYEISYKTVRMTCNIIRDLPGTPAVGSQDTICFLRGRSGRATICLSLRLFRYHVNYFSFRSEAMLIRFLLITESKDRSSIYLPFRWSGIRYQEKEPNGRELKELYILFQFYEKKIRRAKGSKYNTNNITKTGTATAIYFSLLSI